MNAIKQQGFALLMFTVVLIGLAGIGVSSLLNNKVANYEQKKRAEDIKTLNLAKEALLSYSLEYLVNPVRDEGDIGKLPCPDIEGGLNSNGNADTNCGVKGVNAIGYFPYKTVSLGKVTDSSGSCLWYVVSGNYKNAPVYNLLNWDSNGFLNLVDENDNLLHGDEADDFPIALIISPGKSLSQNRQSVAGLEDCGGNYTVTNYLEGGPNINYVEDLPDAADTVWRFLKPGFNSQINGDDYNDQVIAIYKHELWDRVKAAGDLDTSDTGAAIEDLTQELNQCIHKYMTEESDEFNSNAIYPAALNLDDYSDSTEYFSTDTSKRFGRFPENILSIEAGVIFANIATFVTDYCPLSDEKQELWENWKDHFFIVVADDFMPGNTTPIASKCTGSPELCLSINGKTSVAVITFFSEEATFGAQDRASVVGLIDDADIWNQYLDGGNQQLYVGTDATNDFDVANDYAYCITYNSSSLVAEQC